METKGDNIMDLLLIVPPIYTTDEGIYPHLGIISLASYLKKYSCIDVQVLDLAYWVIRNDRMINRERFYYILASMVVEVNPKMVGITTINMSLSIALNLAKTIKEMNRNIIVVFGGPGTDGIERELLDQFSQLDYIICGEGEQTLLELTESILYAREIHSIEGIAGRKDSKIYINKKRKGINLDTLPEPDYSIIPSMKEYSKIMGRNAASVELARGCGGACEFCGCSSFWGKCRKTFSINKVVEKIKKLHQNYDIDHIYLTDDNFLVNREFAIEFANKISDLNIQVSWDTRGRIDNIDKELLDILEKAGCIEILIGVESTSNEILKDYNKRINAEDQYDKIKMVLETDILPILSFILGHPDETKISLHKTLLFLCRIYMLKKPVASHFHILTLVPGTTLYNKKRNMLDVEKKAYRYRNYKMGTIPMLDEDKLLIDNYPYLFSSMYNVRTYNIDIELLEFIAKFYNIMVDIYSYTLYLLTQLDQNLVEVMEQLKNFMSHEIGDWYLIEDTRKIAREIVYIYFRTHKDILDKYSDILDYEYKKEKIFDGINGGTEKVEIQHDIFGYMKSVRDNSIKLPFETYKKILVLKRDGDVLRVYEQK